MKKKLLFFLLFTIATFAQDLPPIIQYPTSAYNAGNQNWMISQDDSGYIYFANNSGLLEYNGTSWVLYPTPNETILRSVKAVGDKIYTGAYMEFGYWKRQPDGTLKYYSLSDTIKSKIIDDEQFWNIASLDHWVIFQSLTQIFIYDCNTKKFNIIGSDTGMNKVFAVNNSIFYQTFSSGLFEIENGKSKLLSNAPVFANSKIVNIFGIEDGLLIQMQYDGFYIYKNGELSKWNISADEHLKSSSIYSSQRLNDGSFALGTVSNGIYILSPSGTVKYHITQNKGLSNNTALSLFEDRDNNLWIGLDNGINCINMQSAVHSYVDDTGFLGTVYASVLYEGNIYVGTNQGLFCKPYNSDADFKFIPGTKGQVWSLYSYDNTLFCGHDYGTFIVKGNSATQIFSGIGTWKFERIPNRPDLLLQGNYLGFTVLEKTAAGWKLRNRIDGFDYSSRFFAINGTDIYISHEYKGIFRITVDKDFRKASGFYAYKSPVKGKNACLTSFNGSIYYAFKEGFYVLDAKTKQFVKHEKLSGVLKNDEYTSGKIIPDNSGRLWFFTKNYINYFSSGKLNSELKHNVIPIPSTLTNSMAGYENITQITANSYLIGTTDGYYTINLGELTSKKYGVYITNVSANELNKQSFSANINQEGSFKYAQNNITFSFTVPEYNKYVNSEFQYKLEGLQDEWSEWTGKSFINFKNLSPGTYVFMVRAKTGNSLSENVARYSFTILKPWYATTFALVIYLFLALVAAYMVNRAYKNYYHHQREKLIEENNRLLEIKELENEQELMRVKNEQLQQDFENKNRELAASTMNLIKKNELLSMIKDDLKKSSDNGGDRSIKSVITTINKNINENDTWDMFKEAFNNADKDFLKKIKKAHPALTPNDLRLCAYLRLNLSSKEIAPLLNISVRSVEIKRYRLRKKMDLPHELGLVEYILSV